MSSFDFEILVEDSLASITSVAQLKTKINKLVLSLVNDFEDTAWRYSKFQNWIWDNIAFTALSQRERSALANKSHSSLIAAAKNLRLTDKDEVGQGSEIAEVFLYGIMHHHYGALPVVPKIFYKQNAQDNVKGADSVHIVLNGDDFSLWFGEAKFYNSISDARLDAIVTSVLSLLSTDKLRKENAIITNISDLDEMPIADIVRKKIKNALVCGQSIDKLKARIHVPILILHECSITGQNSDFTEDYKDQIKSLHQNRAEEYFTRQLDNSHVVHRYDDIHFHIILFPVPDKKKIVDAFIQAVAFYKGR